ncbi:hypothetical protein [Parafrankia elaeagni]|uniref:hypothetical protein n=1 Tax=Parafrankia elaeagni TaxID=222534 RepID=UPI0003624EF8|nr:hypothetical protein [Parafrankia elaeagni]
MISGVGLARRAAQAGASLTAAALGGPLAGLAVVLVCSGYRAVRRWALARYETQLRGAAEDVLSALATELDAGAAPGDALRTALASVGDLPAHPAGERHGPRPGPVPVPPRGGNSPAEHGLLRARRTSRAARRPPGGWLDLPRLQELLVSADDPARLLARCDAAALRQLATAYRVCQLAGVRLAPVATMLADAARSDAARADELASALAGPRSSGRLVAGLPVLGVLLGVLLGASPLVVLVTPPVGTACLATGVLLDLTGLRWLRRIADGVQARVPPVCAGPVEPRRGRSSRNRSRPGRSTSREYRRRLLADLPLALDLVAACLRAGATTQHALEVVGAATGGPAGAQLRATGHALRRGLPADEACQRLLDTVGARRPAKSSRGRRTGGRRHPRPHRVASRPARAVWTGPLPGRSRPARGHETRAVLAAVAAIGRTESSGAKLATTLTRISARARQDAHAAVITAARRAGVMAVAPLGLCFLPAFLLLGVVPVVVGSAPDLGPGLTFPGRG